MKNNIIFILLITMLKGQVININPNINVEPWIVGGTTEIHDGIQANLNNIPVFELSENALEISLRSIVDNSEEIYFRPIFSQEGGSCAQASGVGYDYTYEINHYRNLPSDDYENQYPPGYTYNYLNQGDCARGSSYQDGWNIIADVGIPNVNDYGGMYIGEECNKWMSSYNKYYNAMHNKLSSYWQISTSQGSIQKLEEFKHWLNDHNGENEIGGVAVFSTSIGEDILIDILPSESDEAGKKIVLFWGSAVLHSMTIVGYNDNIQYDFNNDGLFTNDMDTNNDNMIDIRDWEIGAFKVANNTPPTWGDGGFIYMPYRMWYPYYLGESINGAVFGVEIEPIESPQMTIRVKMVHSSRKKINIITGFANNLFASVPTTIKEYEPYRLHKAGNLPMLGISEEPIEIELDITSFLSENNSGSGKYFLEVHEESDSGSDYNGEIISFSLVDYRGDEEFEIMCLQENVQIENNTITRLSINLLLGDLNQDGTLNILDLVFIANMILADEYNEIADMNSDGVLNVLDLVCLVNIILEI